MRVPDLNQLFSFQHEMVLQRHVYDHKCNRTEAEHAFKKLLVWMWLASRLQHRHRTDSPDSRTALPQRLMMFEINHDMDLIWHTFLLFTQDYSKFCFEFFGSFFHHHPEPSPVSSQPFQPTLEEKKSWAALFTRTVSFVYDELGMPWVKVLYGHANPNMPLPPLFVLATPNVKRIGKSGNQFSQESTHDFN